ncbi:receptor-like serine threonine-protein kinase [Musa troglodytarum]|uniref:Receptor-like serine threonine-protein kinase n=1 Tax=Musa troglodytarum TaxID=320322 RepID=A0A9E7KEA9_9LILI|nr:receptor-like serine threonine-protein kinase [Musa troglodytarum]
MINRYPFDRYDRIWRPFVDPVGWTSISTNLTVNNYAKDQFEAPSAVMQTAAVPVNSSTLQFYWDFVGSGFPDNEFYANLHFSELLPNTSRAFDVYLSGEKWYTNYTPPYLMSDAIYSTAPLTPSLRYSWALNSSGLSTLPPILNALEVYTPMFLKNTPTDTDDGSANILVQPEKERLSSLVKGHQDNPLQLDNRQFTYTEVLRITNNFERTLGKGGFGTVYHGYLEDGTQVAVKTRSQSSSQGTKEFLAEVHHLIRIHHKNLVSMVGYCMDGDHLALVYEYMSQGTLLDYIRGLEYLHKGCKPPLIHRDVKTANILLGEQLEAKIADFGLSKAIQNDVTNVPTAVVGTPGYLDPEYYISCQLSEKSDVYSFGVILLELITAEPPILIGRQNAHIVQWVRERLANGNIEDVVDSKLQGEYDVNSVWKVADIAFRCTSQASHQRPSMTNVVAELKESLALECPRDTTSNSDGLP